MLPTTHAALTVKEEVNAPPIADQVSRVRHSLGNSLHGILLQVGCARAAAGQGDWHAIDNNLAQIEKAVDYANEAIEELRGLAGKPPMNVD